MANQPSPRQALFLWNLITSPSVEGVMQSKTRPELSKAERSQLLDQGFLDLERRGSAGYLTPTEKAWAWAGQTKVVALSRSAVGAEVLERLLQRLVPFLTERRLALSELLSSIGASTTTAAAGAEKGVTAPSPALSPQKLEERIERACLDLTQGKRATRVRLSRLRDELADVGRSELDQSLLALQDARRLVLYREDNTAALTDEDHRAALTINSEPRHLVVLGASA